MYDRPRPMLEANRVTWGKFASDAEDGNNGAFVLRAPSGAMLTIVASDGAGWEHVSVSTSKRTPTWEEMCFVKELFWREDELVIQFHPAADDYVDMHKYTLHLWKPIGVKLPTPDPILVGVGRKPRKRHAAKEE